MALVDLPNLPRALEVDVPASTTQVEATAVSLDTLRLTNPPFVLDPSRIVSILRRETTKQYMDALVKQTRA